MRTQTRFTFAKIDHEQGKSAHLVVSLTAPKIDVKGNRTPLCIVPCVDVSGSMLGDKIEYAKRSVLKMIDHLGDCDYCGLVAFGNHSTVLSKPIKMTSDNKDKLRVIVGKLEANGSTNFAGGLLDSLKIVADADLPDSVVSRVIMFTDGHANVGVAKTHQEMASLLAANRGSCTVSAFGYGEGADQELMLDVVKSGKGNYAFIQNPDDALSAFGKELGGLLSTYAQGVSLSIKTKPGTVLTEVVSDVDSEEKDGVANISLTDMLSEEERHVVLGVKIDPQPKAFPRPTSVVEVEVKYSTLSANGKLEEHVESVKGKVEFVKPGEEDKEPIGEVMALVANALIVRGQIEAEEKAKRGDYTGAKEQMFVLSSVLRGVGLSNHADVCGDIGSKMADQSSYLTGAVYLNSVSRGLSSGYSVVSCDSSALDALGKLDVSLCNSSREEMASSFEEVKDEKKDKKEDSQNLIVSPVSISRLAKKSNQW